MVDQLDHIFVVVDVVWVFYELYEDRKMVAVF
jgi:hypothetical protein